MRKTISSGLLLALSATLLASCGGAPQQMGGAAAHKTLTVSLTDRVLRNAHSASLRGIQSVEIRPQVSGVITTICIDEGAAVRKGQTLFIIDQLPYKAALETALANVRSAEARLATAKLNDASQKELFKANIVADFDLQKAANSLSEAQAALAQAKAQETNARTNLSYTEVKSPVNGKAGMIPYRVGALVSSSITEPLVTVSDDSEVYAYFSLTEKQILEMMRMRGGADSALKSLPEVELELTDGTAYNHTGKINAVSGTIDPKTGAVSIRATFPNPEQLLRNGGNGKVVIPETRTQCIAIPQEATFELQGRIYVYKIIDGKASSAPVVISPINDGREYIVLSGLAAGDQIIAAGAGLIREGTPITAAKNSAETSDTTKNTKTQVN